MSVISPALRADLQGPHQSDDVTQLLARLEQLNYIGALLSQERELDALLQRILEVAQHITGADAGTLFLVEGEGVAQRLRFVIVRNHSLGEARGGPDGEDFMPYDPVPLYTADGEPDGSMTATHTALCGETVDIADAYTEKGFDFSRMRDFDRLRGYRTKAILNVPMKDHRGAVIGVLQLINPIDRATGEIVRFSAPDQRLAESLASQAAVAIEHRRLIDQLEELFESFVRLINTAIDEKSPYTGSHCQRVPILTMMLADATVAARGGPLHEFDLTADERYELQIAALLHDCGKITTPVHVVDKATRLETLYDRINLIDTRFEVLRRDAEIEALRQKLALAESRAADVDLRKDYRLIEQALDATLAELDAERSFLRTSNRGDEMMSPEKQARVRHIGTQRKWRDPDGEVVEFLSEDEIRNLCIPKGTLNDDEREVVNYHIVSTINMLEALPWPRHLQRVPEYAGGHHERMDGKGYPRGLNGAQMAVPVRIMAIADIFEALTARDRPYKRGKTLSESLRILGQLALEGHIDPDLFQIFIRDKVYLRYAEKFIHPEQIDEVDESRIPGYVPGPSP